ncbi:MAG: arabinosyltransferase C-terminal domain-containing protein [Lawsonella clevelandensis]
MDPGPTPSWRNLRVRRPHDLPADATAVRLVVHDTSLATDKWIAVTPPRVPQLHTLNQVVGTTDPVLIDWSVGLAFPCQRPFNHRNGIAEQPKWRILPNGPNVESANAWEDRFGGGPLAGQTCSTTQKTSPPTSTTTGCKTGAPSNASSPETQMHYQPPSPSLTRTSTASTHPAPCATPHQRPSAPKHK